MKTFRELAEKYVDSGKKEWQLMGKFYLPLSPSLLQQFEIFIPKCWHVTDLKGLEKLPSLQGKRKDIAVFTRGSQGIARGAWSRGGILVELEGKNSFNSDKDFMSVLDRNGIRWISPYGDSPDDEASSVIYNDFSKIMKKRVMEEIPIDDISEFPAFLADANGKDKAFIIKWYYDEAKKIINKSFIKKVTKKIESRVFKKSERYTNDELLLHDFKILDVKIINLYDDDEHKFRESNAETIDYVTKVMGYKGDLITGDEVADL